jgi:hypothetical protein
MSDALVKFAIPARFVEERVMLTPAELVYGFRGGWLADRDVVSIALARLEAGEVLSPPEEELALLLSDDLGRVPELVDDLGESVAVQGDPAAVWLFLTLAWIYDHRSEYLEPLEVVEMIYADFGYPEEIEGLVRFMPASPGAATGYSAIQRRWEDFLSGKSAEYRARDRHAG